MVQLHSVREATEDVFDDIFDGIDRSHIIQIHECHGREDDDANYAFLIWVDDDKYFFELQTNAYEIDASVIKMTPGLYLWRECVV